MNAGSVGLFLSQLHLQGMGSASIRSSLSALNFINQLAGGENLATHFLISKMMCGAEKLNPPQDIRAPVTTVILKDLIAAIPQLGLSNYDQLMFRAMFNLAFQAFLRVGEMSVNSNAGQQNPNLISVNQISIDSHNRSVSLTFYHYKHSANKAPFTLLIKPISTSVDIVANLAEYLAARGYQPGPLFAINGHPITRRFFNNILQQCKNRAGIQENIKSHSFRIGAATAALINGSTEDQIRTMGRWKSDSYKKYLRVESFHVQYT